MSSLHRGGDTYSEGITTLGHASEHVHGLYRDELLCPICVEPLRDAFVTTCGHTFCYACISTHLQHRRNCPSCFSYLTTEHIHPNFLLNKILSKAALKAPGHAGNTIARTVEQALALAPGPARAKDLEQAIQLLQAQRHHVLQQEETCGLYLLLMLLQDARQRKAAALGEVRTQMSLLEQDLRAMSRPGGSGGDPGGRKRKAEPGEAGADAADINLTSSAEPGVAQQGDTSAASGQLPGSLRVILSSQGGGSLQQLQSHLEAAASAAISQGSALHVHRLGQGVISSISIDRAYLPGLDTAGLAAVIQPASTEGPSSHPAAAQHTPAVAGHAQGPPSLLHSRAVEAAPHQATTAVQHRVTFQDPAVNGQQFPGGMEPLSLGRIQVKRPRRDDRSDMRDDEEDEAGDGGEWEMSTPTSTAYMSRRAFPGALQPPTAAAADTGVAVDAAGGSSGTAGGGGGGGGGAAAADRVQGEVGGHRPGQPHHQGTLVQVKEEAVGQQQLGVVGPVQPAPPAAAAGKLTRRAAEAGITAATAPDESSALGVLRATKKRLMLTQYDDLQQVYMQLRQQGAGSPGGAAAQPPGGGGGHEVVPRLGTASLLKEFGQVLSAVTSYSSMSTIAEVPQAVYGGPGSSLAHSSSSRPPTNRNSSTNLVSCINFNMNEDTFAMCSSQRLFLWNYADVVSRAPSQQAATAHVINRTKLTGLAFSRHEQQVLAASDNEGTVFVYDVTTQQMVMDIEVHDSRIWALDCMPSAAGNAVSGGGVSRCYASGSDDYTVRVWDARDGNVCSTIDTRANVCSVRYCPWDPHYIAVGSAAHAVLLYDLRKAGGTSPALASLAGHTKAVSYVRWGGLHEVVSASTDSSLRLWDVSRFITPSPTTSSTSNDTPLPHPCVKTYSGHVNERHFVGLSVDRDLYAAGSETNEVVVYCKSLTSPSIRHHLPGGGEPGGGGGKQAGAAGRSGHHFISSLTWRHTDRSLVVASSQGSISILALQ